MTRYLTNQNETLDFICWKFYGKQSGAVEIVLNANPGLADLGVIYPENVEIWLPELPVVNSETQPIRLWD